MFCHIVGVYGLELLHSYYDPSFTSVGALSFATGWHSYEADWVFDDSKGEQLHLFDNIMTLVLNYHCKHASCIWQVIMLQWLSQFYTFSFFFVQSTHLIPLRCLNLPPRSLLCHVTLIGKLYYVSQERLGPSFQLTS